MPSRPLLLLFCIKPKYLSDLRLYSEKVVLIWVDMEIGSSAPNVKRAFAWISGWFLPLYSVQTRGRSRGKKTSAFLHSVFFSETEVHLRRARTCTPEDVPFNINFMYMWYPVLIFAWEGLHTVYPTSYVTSLTKTSVKSHTRTKCHLFSVDTSLEKGCTVVF